jgi:hypothetical protein
MSEEKKNPVSGNFDEAMKQSQNELAELRAELQNLLVKFGLRALRTYQAGRPEPLRSMEVERLVKYELDNVIIDLSAKGALDPIVRQAKVEWEKQRGTQTPLT